MIARQFLSLELQWPSSCLMVCDLQKILHERNQRGVVLSPVYPGGAEPWPLGCSGHGMRRGWGSYCLQSPCPLERVGKQEKNAVYGSPDLEVGGQQSLEGTGPMPCLWPTAPTQSMYKKTERRVWSDHSVTSVSELHIMVTVCFFFFFFTKRLNLAS